MKNMISFITVNVLIVVFLIAAIHIKIFFLPLTFFVFLNIFMIYKRSSELDKNEQKKKIMLHNVKNSLGIILGYTEAHNDELITKEELDERKIKDLLAGMTNVGKVIETIEQLEVMVKAEEAVKSKRVKGDAKVNPFELPSIGVGR